MSSFEMTAGTPTNTSAGIVWSLKNHVLKNKENLTLSLSVIDLNFKQQMNKNKRFFPKKRWKHLGATNSLYHEY